MADEKINSSEEKKGKTKNKGKKRKWPWVLLALLVTLNIGGFTFYEYSNTPGFCRSCHLMEPYYDAWQSSTHAKVACIDCHISPEVGAKWQAKVAGMVQALKYITHTYASKPYAEVEDSSCLRSGCHTQRVVHGHATENFKKNIVFDHESHLTEERRGKKLRCTSCHSQMVIGNHMEVNVAACFLCHFKESSYADNSKQKECQTCHQKLSGDDLTHQVRDPLNPNKIIGETSFNHLDYFGERDVNCQSCHSKVITGRGEARKEHCMICHNKPENLERIGDLDFIHKNHITDHNVPCERCHDPIRHELVSSAPVVETGNECSSCHNEPHGQYRVFYGGSGSRMVEEPQPDSMYSALVDCNGCHPQNIMPALGEKRQNIDLYQGCISCHGEDGESYIEMFKETAVDLSVRARQISSRMQKIKPEKLKDNEEMRNRREDALHDLLLLEGVKGWSHNSGYTSEILDSIEELLDELEAM